MRIGDILQYKNFSTRIEFSQDDQVYYGVLLEAEKGEIVSFHGENSELFLSDFHQAVDQYITLRREMGKNLPQNPS